MGKPILEVEERKRTKKKALKKLRKNGFVPAVVYGNAKETKQVQVNKRELDKILNQYSVGSSINFHIGNEMRPAIIKDIQRHITKLHVLHIDLQELDEDKKVKVKIPIYLTNKSVVESSTSVIQQQMTELEIQTYPSYLPQSIEVNVSNMQFGVPLTVGKLQIFTHSHIEVLNESEEIIALLTTATRLEMKEEDSESLLN
ncbi:50S ribosomal protein L25 [Marinisporobacter balticus]|uniref:Large ribosomal subunit protein bL25 n=1 Tax=Marinisporobacter balticus TaxID=2018667 RepID=A0A4V2SAR3_9FIRM|nr:50S ribosomal protein L25 [Marinisporobacter balticus]TCO72640.1 large subunit ribosomal protein L25 [Marinisporobacter balticus]